MLRFTLMVCTLLAACGAGPTRGPAWPKERTAAAGEPDGGESLAPRVAGAVVALDDDDDDVKPTAVAPAAAPASAAKPDKPASATEPAAAKEPEPLTTEEIIIEIED